jgi:hypothetical protein
LNKEIYMAILKGFPPSNTISPTTYIPDVEGEAVVIDTRDPHKMGRVMLDFGSWAHCCHGGDIPTCGTKVKYFAYTYSSPTIYYLWKKKPLTRYGKKLKDTAGFYKRLSADNFVI